MTSAEDHGPLMRAVAEVLGLAAHQRADALAAHFPDPARRAAAQRLLRACELAEEHPLFAESAAELAAPVLAELEQAARPSPELLGAALTGRYSIDRELGRGGQATVYLARDERHRRPVALKVLSSAVLPDGSPVRGAAWFRREIELAEAHAALAHQLFVYQWKWQDAGPALERAVALDPGYPMSRLYHASYLHSIGRSAEALAQLEVAHALDPLHPTAMLGGRIYVDTHRPDDAIRVLQEVLELDPRRDLAHELLAHALLEKRQYTDAVASMRRAAALNGARGEAQLAYVLAVSGRSAEARQVLDRLHASGEPLHLLGFHLGMTYAGLGEPDEAFQWHEKAFLVRGGYMNLLAVSHGFDNIRSDPRFVSLLERIGVGSVQACH